MDSIADKPISHRERPLRVYIVCAHDSVRHALVALMSRQADMSVCGDSGSADKAVSEMVSERPDVVVLDGSQEEPQKADGFITRIAAAALDVRVVVIASAASRLDQLKFLHRSSAAFGPEGASERIVEAVRRGRARVSARSPASDTISLSGRRDVGAPGRDNRRTSGAVTRANLSSRCRYEAEV